MKECFEIKKRCSTFFGFFGRAFRRQAAACNEHIAKIAALPRVDRKSVFLRSLLALKECWDARNFGNTLGVVRQSFWTV